MKLKINKILIKKTRKQIRNKKNKDEIKKIYIYIYITAIIEIQIYQLNFYKKTMRST